MLVQHSNSLYNICKNIDQELSRHIGGDSQLQKNFVLSYLANNQVLKSYIDVGVYDGRNLFPVAYSIYKNCGKSFGIIPSDYNVHERKSNNIIEPGNNNNCTKEPDHYKLFRDLLAYKEECNFRKSISFIRKPFNHAFREITENGIPPDIIHINGRLDEQVIKQVYESYLPLIREGGFIVFDSINENNVKIVYEKTKKDCFEVFECSKFGILLKERKTIKRDIKAEKLSKRLYELFQKLDEQNSYVLNKDYVPRVAVGIMTYNHSEYIEQCLESVISQKGIFRLSVIICDDCSTDGTSEKIVNFIQQTGENERLKFIYIRNDSNIGLVRNLKQMTELFRGSDYFTFCESDDYYTCEKRIEKHLEIHRAYPQCILSFNEFLIYQQEQNKFYPFNHGVKNDLLTTEELVTNNAIGNFSSCFYNSRALSYIKDDLFDMFIADWMFNIFVSQYGDIIIIKETLNVYRKHKQGAWSGLKNNLNRKILIECIDKYNRYLNFTYDEYFTNYRNTLLTDYYGPAIENVDLLIIDDVFPHPMSGFRYQEFTSILREISNVKIYTNSASLQCLGDAKAEEIIIAYKRKYPYTGAQVQKYNSQVIPEPKFLYCNFLQNTYLFLMPLAEAIKVPFIFTLYPGGGFSINTKEGDKKLKRVFQSPYFHKVIVTQKYTYDYLLEKKLCKKMDIEFIFGVVMPLEGLALELQQKKHYSIDKSALDICFVAHKYTPYGEDKGYNIFIEVARFLSAKYENIIFHIVGPWDESVLDITGIRDIRFYGIQNQDWFDNFYIDKDIILSPNIHGKTFAGSFDGFPTACMVDAALRKVAMFGTDTLKLNNGYFIDGEEIVIVDYDASDIVEKIERYYWNPYDLKKLCEKGCEKVKELYSYEKQVEPRLNVLKKAINEEFIPKETSLKTTIQIKRMLKMIIQSEIRVILQKIYHRFVKLLDSK